VIRGIIFDVDGVLEYQGRPYPEATETVAALRARGLVLRFLTNSTLKSRASAAERLRQKGFDIRDEEMFTASYATSCYLREHPCGPCWVLLAREGREEFADIPQDEEHPACIVIGDYRDQFTFQNLNKAYRLLLGGARLVGMIGELVDASLGQPELNVGSWVRMLEAASGVPAMIIGKPYPYAINLVLETMDVSRDTILMVGDRVMSDILGARSMGLQSLLLKTGEFNPADLNGQIQPDFFLNSIAEMIPSLQNLLP
jgi:HAD superfamily hydrolase (TIGR01458 family)